MVTPCLEDSNCSCYFLRVRSSVDCFGVVPTTLVPVMMTETALWITSADVAALKVRDTVAGLMPSRVTVDLLNLQVTSSGKFEQAS